MMATDATNDTHDRDARVDATIAEVREFITHVRTISRGRTDREIALTLLRAADDPKMTPREQHMYGLVGTLLHFAAKYTAP